VMLVSSNYSPVSARPGLRTLACSSAFDPYFGVDKEFKNKVITKNKHLKNLSKTTFCLTFHY